MVIGGNVHICMQMILYISTSFVTNILWDFLNKYHHLHAAVLLSKSLQTNKYANANTKDNMLSICNEILTITESLLQLQRERRRGDQWNYLTEPQHQ